MTSRKETFKQYFQEQKQEFCKIEQIKQFERDSLSVRSIPSASKLGDVNAMDSCKNIYYKKSSADRHLSAAVVAYKSTLIGLLFRSVHLCWDFPFDVLVKC